MRLKSHLLVIATVLGGFIASVFSCPTSPALAARNSSGTYSLPSGNPVVTGTTISTTWANNTLSDISTELTNSLDRNGRGPMLAPLQLSSGTVTSPSLTFSAEPGSGLFRNASNDLRMSVNAATVQQWSTTGTTITGAATVSGKVTGQASGSGFAGDLIVDSGGANAASVTSSLRFGSATSGETIASKRTATGNTFGLDFYTNSLQRMSITSAGGVQIPGSTATTPGTAITASYGATYNVAFGALTVGDCITSSQTLTGVTVGGVCMVSVDGNIHPATTDCYVSAANTVVLRACTPSAVTLSAGNFRVRVFQP